MVFQRTNAATVDEKYPVGSQWLFHRAGFEPRAMPNKINRLEAREGWMSGPLAPPSHPLRNSSAALTGTDFSVLSKRFAGTDRTS